MRTLDDYTLRRLQMAILCNLKDAHMDENFIIKILEELENNQYL